MDLMRDLPPAYPDELWCSRLIRLHRRMANWTFAATLRDIGVAQNRMEAACENTPYATGIMARYYEIRNDEAGFVDAFDNQTVEPFVLRYAPPEMRMTLIQRRADKIGGGRITLVYPIDRPPKPYHNLWAYCPMCYKEDMEMFGEPYWHRAHQIPTVQVCYKHHCRLIMEEKPGEQCQIMPGEIIEPLDPDMVASEWEIRYALCVKAALDAPFDVQAEPNREAVYQELTGRRIILVKAKGERALWRREKFYDELVSAMGEMIARSIAGPRGSRVRLNRLLFGPGNNRTEFFMAIAAMYNLPLDELFTTEQKYIAPERQEALIREMAATGYTWSREVVLRRLNISPDRLYVITKSMGLKQFWKKGTVFGDNGYVTVTANLAHEERDAILRRIKELGVADTSEYIRYCVKLEMLRDGKIFGESEEPSEGEGII